MIRMIYEFFTINLPRFIENLRLELVYAGILSPRIISLRDLYYNSKYRFGNSITNRFINNHIMRYSGDLYARVNIRLIPKSNGRTKNIYTLSKLIKTLGLFSNQITYNVVIAKEEKQLKRNSGNVCIFLNSYWDSDVKESIDAKGLIFKVLFSVYDCTLDYAIVDEKRNKKRERILQKRFSESGNKCFFYRIFSRISKKVLELYKIKRRRFDNEVNRIREFDPYETSRTRRISEAIPDDREFNTTELETS